MSPPCLGPDQPLMRVTAANGRNRSPPGEEVLLSSVLPSRRGGCKKNCAVPGRFGGRTAATAGMVSQAACGLATNAFPSPPTPLPANWERGESLRLRLACLSWSWPRGLAAALLGRGPQRPDRPPALAQRRHTHDVEQPLDVEPA